MSGTSAPWPCWGSVILERPSAILLLDVTWDDVRQRLAVAAEGSSAGSFVILSVVPPDGIPMHRGYYVQLARGDTTLFVEAVAPPWSVLRDHRRVLPPGVTSPPERVEQRSRRCGSRCWGRESSGQR